MKVSTRKLFFGLIPCGTQVRLRLLVCVDIPHELSTNGTFIVASLHLLHTTTTTTNNITTVQ